MNQNDTQNYQNGAKRRPRESQEGAKESKCSGPWSVRKISLPTVNFARQKCKNVHGALVGLTEVTGTRVVSFFQKKKETWGTGSGTVCGPR